MNLQTQIGLCVCLYVSVLALSLFLRSAIKSYLPEGQSEGPPKERRIRWLKRPPSASRSERS